MMNSTLIKLLLSRTRRVPTLLHGTSMEAVLHLFQQDYLPSGDPKRAGGGEPQTLYFCAVKRDFKFHPLDLDLNNIRTAALREAAANYAATIAIDHYVAQNLPYQPPEQFSDHRRNPEIILKEGVHKGYDRAALETIIDKAQKRKGILLGIRKDILELPIFRDEDAHEADRCNSVKIYLPQGLNKKYLFSLQPLGEMERQELDQYLGASK